MTQNEMNTFLRRIDRLVPNQKPSFGKMSAHQMVCHCADQIRLALGTLKAQEYGALKPKEVFAFYNEGKTVPTPKGLGQVEGEGTRPTSFENDIKTLKQLIIDFSRSNVTFEHGEHPYFGRLTKEKWTNLTVYHLNHHLKQFGV